MKGKRTRIDAEIIDAWMKAGNKRPSQTRVRAAESVLRRSNFFVLWRLRRDFKWAQKTLAKAGLDPEEIRWML